MRSERPKKDLNKPRLGRSEDAAGGTSEPAGLFLNVAVSGSTAINYLAQDPALAEKEAAAIFEASNTNKKK
ncbi:MAG: hypothetical protein K8F91_10805 [Candidatus Obscuribacterales bacterium]|nr:hypothetical protein [Candidatus Obscuribacterales bacterium]